MGYRIFFIKIIILFVLFDLIVFRQCVLFSIFNVFFLLQVVSGECVCVCGDDFVFESKIMN
jgi:hypothetical protein